MEREGEVGKDRKERRLFYECGSALRLHVPQGGEVRNEFMVDTFRERVFENVRFQKISVSM